MTSLRRMLSGRAHANGVLKLLALSVAFVVMLTLYNHNSQKTQSLITEFSRLRAGWITGDRKEKPEDDHRPAPKDNDVLNDFDEDLTAARIGRSAVGPLRCMEVQQADWIDCHPDNEADPESCARRHCCWKNSSRTNVMPRCVMPLQRGRYAVTNRTSTGSGYRLQLELSESWSELQNESKRLTLDVTRFAYDTARLRIFDPSKKEFEPPVPEPTPEQQASMVQYTATLKSSGSLVIEPTGRSKALFAVHLESMIYADNVKQLAIGLRSAQFYYGLRGPKDTPFIHAGRWSKHTFYQSEDTDDYNDKGNAGVFKGLHPFLLIVTEDPNWTLGLFVLTGHNIELTLSPKRIATFRTTGGLLDVFFFSGSDPMSVLRRYLHLVGFPSLPSFKLLARGISRPRVHNLDGGILGEERRHAQEQALNGDFLPRESGTQWRQCSEPPLVQQSDPTDPMGAWNFHALLNNKDLPDAADYRKTIIFQRPQCPSDGNASARTLTTSRHSGLWSAYATLLAKVTYRSIAKELGETAQLLVQSTFPGAGRWSGYWNTKGGPLKRTLQDMLLHNMMGIPVYRADVCDLNNGVDANTSDACSRLASLAAYFPLHRRVEGESDNFDNKRQEDPAKAELRLRFKAATSRAANLRTTLLPYTFTALHQFYKTGAVLARPMFFEFPGDRKTHAFPTQFMYGPHLLITPATKLYGSTKLVEAYLPRGVWYEPYRGRRIESFGQVFFVPEPEPFVVPFFARAGSIVPVAETGGIQLLVFLDTYERAAGDLFQMPNSTQELKNLATETYSLFHFFYVKGMLTGHCTPCAVRAKLSSVWIYGITRHPTVVDINGRPLNFNASGKVLTVHDVDHDATSPFLISVA
ncbi:lysosomal alpha-glucosidase-like [Dermacentor albipictus]|uniref:lysosomal alpha-glucosidase-like n=1 Tax=Dermacentor albipictus TaxID=60249 RepID=UPI0038FC9557